jgi:hypothetical protein
MFLLNWNNGDEDRDVRLTKYDIMITWTWNADLKLFFDWHEVGW